MADMNAYPLQQFMASLDKSCLPRILQVCSGVYFQGSVYELSGCEVCFSTGDIIKVTDIELHSVSCEDVSSNEKFELPIDYNGLFKVIPESYSTVEEMVALRPFSLECGLPFSFTCCSKISFDNLSLGTRRALTVLSIEQHEGKEDQLHCLVAGPEGASTQVCIPFSTLGEFLVCEGKELFTLQEIMSSPRLRHQRFRHINQAMSERVLILSPVYEIHAIMKCRKNTVTFQSSLDMDVIDVTDECQDVNFEPPLSLTEVFSKPDETFPAVVEIMDGPETDRMVKCSWLAELSSNRRLIFHRKGTSSMFLISTMKGLKAQKHFLVSQQYGGRLRRQPREFNSVFELYVASVQGPGLRVRVTRHCDEVEEEGVPDLSVGEQLEVLSWEKVQLPCGGSEESVEALFCRRLQDLDDGSDDDEEQEGKRDEIHLPLCMQAHFVEVLTDNRKYSLRELGRKFNLPLDVKVVSRDTELEADPLAAVTRLRIQEAMRETTIQASFANMPERCFEIPTQKLFMSVHLSKEPLPWPIDQPPTIHVDSVTEVTDVFVYEFRKQSNSGAAPPPRPPKKNQSTSSKKTPPAPSDESLTRRKDKHLSAPPTTAIFNKQLPPLKPQKPTQMKTSSVKAQRNTFTERKQSQRTASPAEEESDEDHVYEMVEETLMTVIKEAREMVLHY